MALDLALKTRYRIDIDTITEPPAGIGAVDFDEIAAIMPFNLAVIMLARAYQRLQAGEARPVLLPRFTAIRTVCAPLWARLESRNIGDMQTRQILWVAAAEEVLCVGAQGHATVIPMATALEESPTGAGRSEIIGRTVEILLHGEHPYRAARLARAEALPHMRTAGDIATMAMVKAFLRESAYGARRWLRAR
jgi:hypothetical protein